MAFYNNVLPLIIQNQIHIDFLSIRIFDIEKMDSLVITLQSHVINLVLNLYILVDLEHIHGS